MQISNIQMNPLLQDLKANSAASKTNLNFSELLIDAMEGVNKNLHDSQTISNQFLIGETDSIHDVRIAGIKAELSFSMALETTNKILSAYNEIMRLQL